MTSLRLAASLARANLSSRRLASFLLALTLAAASALLTVGLVAQGATGQAWDRLWRATNGADLWLYLDASQVSPAAVDEALARVPGIRAHGPPMAEVNMTPLGVAQRALGSLALREWVSDPAAIGRPLLVSGRPAAPGESDSVVVDRNVSRSLQLRIGHSLVVAVPGGRATLRVAGLSASAENCPHPLCGPTTLYVGPGALRALRLAPSSSPGQLQLAVALRSADSSSAGVHALRDAISRALPPGSVVAGIASTDTRRFSNLGYAFQAGVFLAFSIVALAAAGSLILVTLGAAVRSDSRRIGLLKAVGFTARQLRLTVLAEYAGIAIAAGGSGSLIAAAAAPRLFASVVGQYGPGGVRSQWVDAGLALTVVAVLASVITLVASRRAVRIDAVSALRQEVGAGARPTGIVHGPVVVSRAISDLRTRRARSLLTTTALGLAAFTTAFALIIFSGFGVFFRQIGIGGARQGDVVVATPSQIPPGSVESVLRRQPGVAALVREENTTFTFPDSTETMVLRLRSGDTEALALPLVTGRQPRLPGEALVGFGLARQRHLRPGDHMVVSVAGVPGELSVVGINRDATNLGRTVAILAATLPQAHHFFPPLYYLRPRAGMAAERVAAGIRRQSGGTLDPVVFDARVLPASIRDVGPVLGALVLALGLLTGLGVLNSVMLGVQERRREIGILRTLGMRTSEIVGSVLTGAGGLALLGSAAALPLAVVAARAAFGAIGRGTGVGALNVGVPTSVAAVPAIAVAIGLVGAALPAWVASSTSVTAVLHED